MIETIPSMLEHACKEFPNEAYLSEKQDKGWISLSFAESRQHIHYLFAALKKNQISGPMALLAEGRSSWVICENSIFLLHSFSVPLSIKLSADEISFRLEHSKAKTLVCSKLSSEKALQSISKIQDSGITIIYLDNDEETINKFKATGLGFFTFNELIDTGKEILKSEDFSQIIQTAIAELKPEDTATVSYTSGTTGNPKGIMLSQSNYYYNVKQATDGFPMPRGMRMFVILPIDHAFAHTIALYAPLLINMSLWFVDARGGAMGILRNIPINMKEVKPNIMLTVPSLTANFMQKIINTLREKGGFAWGLFQIGLKAKIYINGNAYKKPPFYTRILPFFPAGLAELLIFKKVRETFGGELKYCIGGGASMDLKQQEFFSAIGIPVFQGYGLTEAAPVISTSNINRHKIGSSGPVIPGVNCAILDETLQALPLNTKGQIAVQGPNVMKGYLYNEAASQAAITKDQWLLTGDLGLIDNDGFLHVIGREKALLISSDGEKYSPEEMEDAITASSSYINQCMLWCDHRNYTSALITLDLDELKIKLKSKKIKPEDSSKILEDIIQNFSAYLKDPAYSDLFPRQWRPKCFVICPKQFNENDGTINSTMKMVRGEVYKLYKDLIDYQYTSEGNNPQNPLNLKTLQELL